MIKNKNENVNLSKLNLGKIELEKEEKLNENPKPKTSRLIKKKNRNKRNSISMIPNSKTEISPLRHPEKKKTVYEPSKNPRSSINKYFKDKEEEVEKNLRYKKRCMEINILSKERAKLKKLLILTTDIFSLRILSQKIMKLNNRINKLFNINEGLLNEPEEKIKKIKKKKTKKNNNNNYDDDDSSDFSEDEEENLPIYKKMKRLNNYLKIDEIYHEGKIIDIHTVISAIKDKPNFVFQRNEKNKFYLPSTNYINKRKFGNSTIFDKSFKPVGFTNKSINDIKNKKSLKKNFDDLYFNIFEENKNKNYEDNERNNTENNIKNSFFNKNKYNSKIRIYSSSYRPTTCSNSSNQKSIFFNPVKKSIPIINKNNTYSLTEFSTITNSNIKNNYNHSYNIGSNLFQKNKNIFNKEENMKNEIKEILNNTKVIKESIEDKIEKNYSIKQKDNEKVLLKLANKLYKPKKIKYKIFNHQNEEELTLENEYVRKLKKIPKSCKDEFRDCFKEILYQDRILNKLNPNQIDA